MPAAMELIDQYIEDNRDAFQQDLFELLKIPSVSTDSRHKDDMQSAAAWVADQFRAIQFQTEIVPTPGHPIVYAQSPKIDGAPRYSCMDITTCSPPIHWTSGYHRLLNQRFETEVFMHGVQRMIKGKC